MCYSISCFYILWINDFFHSLLGCAVASYIALRRSFVGDRLVSSIRYFGNQGEGRWVCLVPGYVWKPVPCYGGVGVHIRFLCGRVCAISLDVVFFCNIRAAKRGHCLLEEFGAPITEKIIQMAISNA